jgi:hypothetical protein
VTTASRHSVVVARTALWTRLDLVRTSLLLLLGVVLWVVGWYNASDDLDVDNQIAPLNLSVAGTLVAGAGFVLWFLAGRRAVGARRRVIVERRRSLVVPVESGPDARPQSLAPRAASGVLVGGSNLRRFHRSDCPLAAGRTDWTAAARAEHSAAGRVACGVCLP